MWSPLYFFVTATLAALPALSCFLPPLPFILHLDAVVPVIGLLFDGLRTVQAARGQVPSHGDAPTAAHMLWNLIDRRHQQRPTAISSNIKL